MGGGPSGPPVLTLSNCCPNGVQLSPSGLPHQFTVISDQVANLVVFLNGNSVGNYSNVTIQNFSLSANSNYNLLRIVGSNSNGSSECICYFYGTTGVGDNGSNYYYDQNDSNNIQITFEDIHPILQLAEAGGAEALRSAANALSLYLQGFENPPPGAHSLEGPIPCFAFSILPAAIIAQQLSTPGSPLNLIIGQNTIMQYNSDYSNNWTGQGMILINNNQTTISWGPDNWA